MPHDPYAALYIHIPFCASKCAYCDFHSHAEETASAPMTRYVEDLILDIKRLAQDGELASIETIYLGGGTPTHLGHGLLTQLLYAISLYVNLDHVEEFTMEANPESLSEAMVKDAWALGVNRLSIGVQTFEDDLLKAIGRPHTAADAEHAIRDALVRFDNVSIDLMCGLPGQTVEGVERDISRALSLGVKHVSLYPLSVEPGTELYRRVRKGLVGLPGDDEVADMLEAAERILEEEGLSRYEVASYGLPGYASKHNKGYWQGRPYLGLGASATTMTQNAERRMRVKDGQVVDDLDARQMAAEDLMLAMRMAEGASDDIVFRASQRIEGVDETLGSLEELGLIEHGDGAWRPTERGWLCGNELYGALLDLAP